nr:retrovirus-related Pol polyprotein from transposon TNT 1-94 [Tanacetum cinerariifolium]
ALRREYELLSIKVGEKVDTYLVRMLTVVNKMKVNGDPLTASSVVAKILRSLTLKFNYVVCSIEESNNLDTMTIDELHGSLLVHEQRMTRQQQKEDQVLKVTTSSSYRGRGRGRSGYRGITHSLTDVYYAPDLRKNLISVGRVQEKGVTLLKIVRQKKNKATGSRQSVITEYLDVLFMYTSLKKKRKKLDDRSLKCVMFGVSEESKANLLYDPVNNKIVISKDVVFEEENAWPWNQ